ncbi:MAG: hypothetical protein IKD16_05420 [Bacteroidales bacterium]|nr:hypothetical protein [Bacteroidales bacterium]
MKKLWRVPVLLLAAIVSSCSIIEEDRSICPCWYTIDLTEVDRSMQNLHLWVFNQDGILLYCDTLQNGAFGKYEMKLDKGKAFCYIWGNLLDGTILENRGNVNSYFVKAGDCSSDPLFKYSSVFDTSGETGIDTVFMNKEFANVDFTLKGKLKSREQLELRVDMKTVGRYIHGGYMEGENAVLSSAEFLGEDYSLFKFRITRQEHFEQIMATITALVEGDRYLIKYFPLGEWLISAGYDPMATNMADITMELDMALGILSVRTANWQTILPVNIEI